MPTFKWEWIIYTLPRNSLNGDLVKKLEDSPLHKALTAKPLLCPYLV